MIIYEFADILGSCSFKSLSISGHTVFPRNSKDFQVSFSPFALKNTSFFLERMGITVYHGTARFYLTFLI